ncbi:SET domain-containing protein [Patescibacteria group bacterium]|jgi:SET domain-containing protein|nr:SET domain-containing protein [Patescibacteria group bacterium]
MLYVKTVIKQSLLHGTGLFADQRIAKGALISKFEPGFDIFITAEKYASLPEAAKSFFDHYGYWSKELNGYVCSADNHRFTNHSTNPSVGTVGAKEGDDGDDIALRDIEPGEEITVDYRVFGEDPEQTT